MKFKYPYCLPILLFLLCSVTQASDTLEAQKPTGINESQWANLKTAVQEAKLLPTPEGFGGQGSQFGFSVAVEGDRALVGGPFMLRFGLVYVLEFDGINWVETAVLQVSDAEDNDYFGWSVSLSGDRALIGAHYDDDSGTDSGSAYVFDYDGTNWNETAKLTASDGAADDWFGKSVSLSGDRALIGSSRDDVATSNSGSAYVYDFDGNNWTETEKITAGDAALLDMFGASVSLDGNRALIGATSASFNGFNSGAAYVFDFDGNNWSESSKLGASDAEDADVFGYSVSLSGDRILIGAYNDDDNGSGSGSAYVYDYDGISWSETSKLTASDGVDFDNFGWSVSLAGDRALIGAYRNSNGIGAGSAYVFDFDGMNWSETSKLAASDGDESDNFGFSVDISDDRILVGANLDNDAGTFSGSTYVYEFDGLNWFEGAKLQASEGASNDHFGHTLSLSGDRALIGSPYDDNGAVYVFDYDGTDWNLSAKFNATTDDGILNFGFSVSLDGDRALIGSRSSPGGLTSSGAAYVFEFDGINWFESSRLLASDAAPNDLFGWSVSLSGDRALIGAFLDDDNASASGSAYVFDYNGISWVETTKLIASDGFLNEHFGWSVSLSDDRALIGARYDDSLGTTDSGSAYVFDYDGSNWSETAKLTAGDESSGDYFGWSVSLYNDTALIGAPQESFIDRGAAYVFGFDGNQWTETKKLRASDFSADDQFGYSVSLYRNQLIIGSRFYDGIYSNSGAAYVFNYDVSGWSETTILTAPDAYKNDLFGYSVSISQGKALVSSYADDDRGTDSGSAYVFDLGNTYELAMDVSGLSGSGLMLQNNSGDNLAIGSNGLSVFATELADGDSYDVTVNVEPSDPNQTCVISNPTGQVMGSNIVLDVVCNSFYSIGVTVSGLDANNSIELSTNGQTLIFNNNSTADFPTQWLDGTEYEVILTAQPTEPNQTCDITGGNGANDDGSGTIDAGDVEIFLNCETIQYDVNISVSGLLGNGLSFTNGADALDVTDNGTATLSTLNDGSAFDVLISEQPQSPNQMCDFNNNPAGVLIGTDYEVTVACVTSQYMVGGTVSGLADGNQVVLQNNSGDDLAVNEDGFFMFDTSLEDLSTYAVTVLVQPTTPNQVCGINGSTGQLSGEDIDSIAVICETNVHTIGGVVSGLVNNNSVNLSINGGDEHLMVDGNMNFTFVQALQDSSNYSVTVFSDPSSPNQTCAVSNGEGTVSGADVTDVMVHCVITQYYIGGYLNGLIPGNFLVVQNNGSDDLALISEGAFVFSTPLDDKQNYTVTIQNQPNDPIQPCAIFNNSGFLSGGDVDDIVINCKFGDDLIYRHGFDTADASIFKNE